MMRQMFFIGEISGLYANSAPRLFYYEAMLLYLLQHVVLHCPAEIHKAFPEIDSVWRGAYFALKT